MYYLIILFGLFIAADQYSKYLIVTHMSVGESIVVIPHYFYLTYLINPGAAFGMLANYRILFVLASIILFVAYIYYFKKLAQFKWWDRIAVTMLVSGALGNMIDRVRINGVIDFIDFRVWPIFNFADIFICVGVAILIYSILMGEGAK